MTSVFHWLKRPKYLVEQGQPGFKPTETRNKINCTTDEGYWVAFGRNASIFVWRDDPKIIRVEYGWVLIPSPCPKDPSPPDGFKSYAEWRAKSK